MTKRTSIRGIFAVGALLLGACEAQRDDRLPGYAEGEFVYVAAPVAGKLGQLSVTRGANVEAGAELFALDDTEQRAARDVAAARLAQAQATLRDARKGQRPTELQTLQAQLQQATVALQTAEADLTRLEKLRGVPGGTSEQQVDHAKMTRDQTRDQVAALNAQLRTARLGARDDQVSAAQANVDALQAQLRQVQWGFEQTRQTAPASGLIVDTLYRTGEVVSAARPVVILLPPANIKVRTFVPEARLSQLQAGHRASVFIDGREQPLTATVCFISPRMEFTPPVIYSHSMRSKFVAMVELTLSETDAKTLHPGQPVDVQFVE